VTAPPQAFEAALIVPVPEAEPVVGGLRHRLDPSAALGIPAHITINYPFKPRISRPLDAHKELSSLLSRFPQFTFTLSEIRTFPGVVYLAPKPTEPFLALINAVATSFPDSPPYEGQFPQPVPHLTVAQVEESRLAAAMAEVAQQAAPALPLPTRARELWLMDNSENFWKTRAVFRLKPS